MDIIEKLAYTPKELTQLIPVSLRTLSRDRKEPFLFIPFKKIRRKVIYPADKVKEWLNTTDISILDYQAKVVTSKGKEIKKSKGRPVGTTKAELAKRRKFSTVN